MWHTFKHFIHMLPTNLVIIFVHWVSTGVLYEPRQYSLFWGYIPESKLCFCLNLCRPPGTYSIRPIQKLLNCQQRDDALQARWGAAKNSAVALSLRNNMMSIHQRGARTNEGKTTLIYSYSRTVAWMVSSFSASCSWRPLDWRIHHSHLASTLFHSLVPWWRPRRIRPQITRLSQLENSAMGTWPIYKNFIIPDWFEKWRDIKFWYMC